MQTSGAMRREIAKSRSLKLNTHWAVLTGEVRYTKRPSAFVGWVERSDTHQCWYV